MRLIPVLAAASLLAAGQPAAAQSVGFMLDECGGFARQYFGDYEARADMKYNGERTDGTHAVGGDIYLETRAAHVACSFASDMMTITALNVDGQDQSAFLPGGGGGGASAGGGGSEQDAVDACIDGVRAETGGLGGEVLSSEFSEAGTLVTLRDAEGTTWRCIAYSDGTLGELRVAEAGGDDGGGAMAGAGGEQRVRFPAGSSGTELTGTLAPGASMRYVLGASKGQDLYVRVAHQGGPRLDFQIFNPDDSFLLEMIPTDREYRGQLWQSGDHVVEVINRGGATAEYNIIFGID